MFIIKSFLWKLLFPFFYKYYGVKEAKTKFEKEQVFKFRYKIYRIELGHYFLDDKHIQNQMLFDEEDFLDNTVILYSGSIDNITGTIRFTFWKNFPDHLQKKYKIDPLLAAKFKTIWEIRFFQIASVMRKSLVGLTFVSSPYKIMNEKPEIIPDIMFADCQPGLVENYRKIGGFNYTDEMIFEEFGILQVPMAMAPNDFAYLRRVHSITYFLIKHAYRHQAKFIKILPHFSLTMSPEQAIYFRNLLEKEPHKKTFDLLISQLKNIIVLPIKKDTIIIRKNIIDYDIFFIAEGEVGIYVDNILLTTLTPGNMIGEMALISDHHRRSTDVISLTDAKILLIPRNFLSRLERKNPKLAIRFLHIVSENLSDKLSASNTILLKHLKNPSTK